MLKDDPALPSQRVRELIEPLGFDGGKTIVDDYLREVRPLFAPPRTYQRTVYRRGELCQFDLWEPKGEIAVGDGQRRRGWVVVACSGYSRAGTGALIFSKEKPELLFGIRRCLWSLGALPETLVWDRQSGLHAGGGRPTAEFAAFCGRLRVGWHFCAPRDPQAKGCVERLQDFLERSFEPGRLFANELDFQLQLDAWFDERANPRMHKTLRARPIDRLREEHAAMRPLPAIAPAVDRRWVLRVAPDPYLRFDSCDYSLDPRLEGQFSSGLDSACRFDGVIGGGAFARAAQRSLIEVPEIGADGRKRSARPGPGSDRDRPRRRGRTTPRPCPPDEAATEKRLGRGRVWRADAAAPLRRARARAQRVLRRRGGDASASEPRRAQPARGARPATAAARSQPPPGNFQAFR